MYQLGPMTRPNETVNTRTQGEKGAPCKLRRETLMLCNHVWLAIGGNCWGVGGGYAIVVIIEVAFLLNLQTIRTLMHCVDDPSVVLGDSMEVELSPCSRDGGQGITASPPKPLHRGGRLSHGCHVAWASGLNQLLAIAVTL